MDPNEKAFYEGMRKRYPGFDARAVPTQQPQARVTPVRKLRDSVWAALSHPSDKVLREAPLPDVIKAAWLVVWGDIKALFTRRG